MIPQNHSLAEELARLQGVCEAQRELLRADSALSRHIAEMDEFEEKSKHDRAKALSGEFFVVVLWLLNMCCFRRTIYFDFAYTVFVNIDANCASR